MNLVEKTIFSIYALFFITVLIAIILFSIELISLKFISTSLPILYGRWEIGVIGFILLIANIKFLLHNIRPKRLPETTVTDGELGKVCITLNAIESLVLKVIQGIENIKDSKIKIKKKENGVSVLLRLTVNHDVVIPEITFKLQKAIKDYTETTAGIYVSDVQVSIDNVSNHSKQKAT